MTNILPYKRAHEILEDDGQEAEWLVEGLWGDAAVGIVGGEPKNKKSFFALDVAVSVASGQPCLGRFAVKRGRVLLYAAEDPQKIVRKRLRGIAAARGVRLEDCDIDVITVERLRLDQKEDLHSLDLTIESLKPRLLILDPFVRLHRIDENSSAEVSGILDNLRVIQKRYGTAIMVVHHAKKNGGKTRGGQALRGSSEFHAWLDSMVYIRRGVKDQLILSVEHRAAAPIEPVYVELKADGDKLALAIVEPAAQGATSESEPSASPAERIVRLLGEHGAPVTLATLREATGVRTATFCQELKGLIDAGRVTKLTGGLYTLRRL